MNKTQLVDALTARIGDRQAAASAVDGVLETIVETVRAGGSVSLTGFGVFEGRARAARVARNPRTGEAVDVAATTVPAFRPGTGFRAAVGGSATPAPRPAAARTTPAADLAAEAVADAPAKVARGSGGGGGGGGGGKAKKAAKDQKAATDEKAAKEEKTAKDEKAKGKKGKGKAKK